MPAALFKQPTVPESIGLVLFLCSSNSMLKVWWELHLSQALFEVYLSFLAGTITIQKHVEVRFEEDPVWSAQP